MEYKFQKLKNFFINQHAKRIDMTFDKIEKILGFKLCDSAYKYQAYWNHKSSPTHTFPRAWVEAGYEIESMSKIDEHRVIFIRR